MKVFSLEHLLEKAMLELEMADTGTDMCRIHRVGFSEGVRYAYDEIIREIALNGGNFVSLAAHGTDHDEIRPPEQEVVSGEKQTAVDWFYEKIKSHFEHDGDLLEVLTFTMAIAKEKEREERSEQLPILDRCGCEEPNEEPIKVCMNCNGYVE